MPLERIGQISKSAIVFSVAFIVGLAAILQFNFMQQIYDDKDFLNMGLWICLITIPLYGLTRKWHEIISTPKREFLVVLWLVVLAASIRLTLLPILSTNAWSDMLTVHQFALDVLAGQPTANLSNYPHIPNATYLNMLGFTLAGLYKIFGASFQTAKAFMTVCASFATGLFYYSGKKLGNNDGRVGFLGGLAFATLPALAAYTGVLTGEHIATPILLLVIFLFSQAIDKLRSPIISFRYVTLYFVLCGTLIGLLDWYRPVGTVLLIAFIIAYILDEIKKNKIGSHLILMTLLVVSYNLVSQIPLHISETLFERRIMSSSDRLGESLLVGLNPVFKGVNNLNDWDIIATARKKFGEDFNGYRQYLIAVALSRVAPAELISIFTEKFTRIWSNHEQLFFFAAYGSNDQELLDLLRNIDIIITWILSLFALIGVLSFRKNPPFTPKLAISLFILGFTIMTLLLEAQNRYITLLIPYWILLASLGFRQIIDWLDPSPKAQQFIDVSQPNLSPHQMRHKSGQ